MTNGAKKEIKDVKHREVKKEIVLEKEKDEKNFDLEKDLELELDKEIEEWKDLRRLELDEIYTFKQEREAKEKLLKNKLLIQQEPM